MICLGLLLSCLTAGAGSVFLPQLLRVLGTVPGDGALYDATRDYLQVLILSTPLFYLSNLLNYYLRNDGSQRLAGTGSVVGNLCDIGLNILLVLVLDMGTRGRPWPPPWGRWSPSPSTCPGLFRQKGNLRPGLPGRGWPGPRLVLHGGGMATSVQYLYQMIFFLVSNNLLMNLGGELGVAAFDVLAERLLPDPLPLRGDGQGHAAHPVHLPGGA